MTTNSLATVLIKVLGLSLTISGIESFGSGISSALFWISLETQQRTSHIPFPPQMSQIFSNFGISGILHIGLGLFLIIKTSYVVAKILNIRPEA